MQDSLLTSGITIIGIALLSVPTSRWINLLYSVHLKRNSNVIRAVRHLTNIYNYEINIVYQPLVEASIWSEDKGRLIFINSAKQDLEAVQTKLGYVLLEHTWRNG